MIMKVGFIGTKQKTLHQIQFQTMKYMQKNYMIGQRIKYKKTSKLLPNRW